MFYHAHLVRKLQLASPIEGVHPRFGPAFDHLEMCKCNRDRAFLRCSLCAEPDKHPIPEGYFDGYKRQPEWTCEACYKVHVLCEHKQFCDDRKMLYVGRDDAVQEQLRVFSELLEWGAKKHREEHVPYNLLETAVYAHLVEGRPLEPLPDQVAPAEKRLCVYSVY